MGSKWNMYLLLLGVYDYFAKLFSSYVLKQNILFGLKPQKYLVKKYTKHMCKICHRNIPNRQK